MWRTSRGLSAYTKLPLLQLVTGLRSLHHVTGANGGVVQFETRGVLKLERLFVLETRLVTGGSLVQPNASAS